MATNPIVELFYSGAWHDITSDVRTDEPITITRGRPNESQRIPPSTMNLTIGNADGKYSPRNPVSPLYGLIGRNTPIRATVNGTGRFYGEVESWPQRWNVKGSDVRAPITANGILRRLNAPGTARPALSALLRTMPGTSPVYYWPMEDGTDAASFASGVGGSPLTPQNVGYVHPGSDSRVPGSAPIASFDAFGNSFGDSGSLTEMPIPGLGSTKFTVALAFTGDLAATPVTTSRNLFRINLTGGSLQYVFCSMYQTTISGVPSTTFFGFDVGTSSANLANNFNTGPHPYDGKPHTLLVTFEQVGADVNGTATIDGVPFANDFGLLTSKTLGTPTTMVFNELLNLSVGGHDATNNIGTKIALGHIAIWGNTTPTDEYIAMTGFAGETAQERLDRLCTEEGIALTVDGLPDQSELMGPQRVAPVVDLWNDAADADGGILYETRDAFGLTYRQHVALYNQAPIITLNYAAGGEVAPPLEPVEDTDHIANDVTVTRSSGASTRLVQESGPLNVQDPTADPNGVGRYAKQFSLVLYQDSQTVQQAAWMRHLGTWDEARYPIVRLDLTAMVFDRKTTLADDAVMMDIGNRISITNVPSWLPPDSIEQLVQGYTEIIESHHWTIAANAIPASPYDVLQLETDVTHNLSRIPAADGETTLSGSLTTTATSVGITSTTVRWIDSATYAAQFPFDILIGGERMRVTACTGTVLTQTFTVIRSINGVVKAHAAGETVQLFRPPVIAR